jgi:hypothetical protein
MGAPSASSKPTRQPASPAPATGVPESAPRTAPLSESLVGDSVVLVHKPRCGFPRKRPRYPWSTLTLQSLDHVQK